MIARLAIVAASLMGVSCASGPSGGGEPYTIDIAFQSELKPPMLPTSAFIFSYPGEPTACRAEMTVAANGSVSGACVACSSAKGDGEAKRRVEANARSQRFEPGDDGRAAVAIYTFLPSGAKPAQPPVAPASCRGG